MVSVEPGDVLADHVELNVKGIFMPRGDLYRMMSSIVGKTVYGSKTFQVPVRSWYNCSAQAVIYQSTENEATIPRSRKSSRTRNKNNNTRDLRNDK